MRTNIDMILLGDTKSCMNTVQYCHPGITLTLRKHALETNLSHANLSIPIYLYLCACAFMFTGCMCTYEQLHLEVRHKPEMSAPETPTTSFETDLLLGLSSPIRLGWLDSCLSYSSSAVNRYHDQSNS